jgi:hypothetical protein
VVRPDRSQHVTTLSDGPASVTIARYGAAAADGGPRQSDTDITIQELVRLETSPQYWLYLYEQCGGIESGAEDPAAGMDIVRNALRALYSGDIVDIASSTDIAGALPELMDRALAETPSCPFTTLHESLFQFAEETM